MAEADVTALDSLREAALAEIAVSADLTALGDDEMQGALDMVANHAAITGTTSTSAPAM